LTLTSFQALYGRVSDIFGRKSSLLFAYTTFGVGCFFCGLARNLKELVTAWAGLVGHCFCTPKSGIKKELILLGIGGGGVTTLVTILCSDLVPMRERGKWQGYINIIIAIGTSAGASLGGVLADSIGWRW
jgi:MFS family permease